MALDLPVWFQWLLIVVLIVFSGLFSGLNLGLMGLDPAGLEIAMASDNVRNRTFATKIQPLRTRGNWLLCTLLLGNVAVNSGLSILLAERAGGTVGFLASTIVIVIFGEIIPQALCSRYALPIGARTTWIVWPLMFAMSPIAYPIAYLLDRTLGAELGHVYSNKELQKLVALQAEKEGTGINERTAAMLQGALGLHDTLVSDVMTDIKEVFWLDDCSKLSFDVLTQIFKSGHSRIPIFNTQDKFGRIACSGLLYVKDLILLDPDDQMPVTQIMNAFRHKTPPTIWKDDTLQKALQTFISSAQHLAFVQDVVTQTKATMNTNTFDHNNTAHSMGGTGAGLDELDNAYEYVGIITLEDVIEHVLQTQLVDEHDNFVDRQHRLRTNRLNRIDWEMLNMFDHRHRVLNSLPPQELQAVYHFLSQTVKPFWPKNRTFTEAAVKNLLASSSVVRVKVSSGNMHQFNMNLNISNKTIEDALTHRDPYKDVEDNGLLLYQRDKLTKYFTLILDGKCEIYSGRQGFKSEVARWSYLCPDALDRVVEAHRYHKPVLEYCPDFTCKVIENSRILRIKLSDFKACLEGQYDFDSPNNNNNNNNHQPNLPPHSPDIDRAPVRTTSEPHIVTHGQAFTPRRIADHSHEFLHENMDEFPARESKSMGAFHRINLKNNLSYQDEEDDQFGPSRSSSAIVHKNEVRHHVVNDITDNDKHRKSNENMHNNNKNKPNKRAKRNNNDNDSNNNGNKNKNKKVKVDNIEVVQYQKIQAISTADNNTSDQNDDIDPKRRTSSFLGHDKDAHVYTNTNKSRSGNINNSNHD